MLTRIECQFTNPGIEKNPQRSVRPAVRLNCLALGEKDWTGAHVVFKVYVMWFCGSLRFLNLPYRLIGSGDGRCEGVWWKKKGGGGRLVEKGREKEGVGVEVEWGRKTPPYSCTGHRVRPFRADQHSRGAKFDMYDVIH